ncbi:UNVERIFIED_ORG: hypothetical protein GGI57_004066 [Rhizobium aethiopicum]
MRVDAFDAEAEDGKPVRVIGVIDDDNMMKFPVIEEDEDGAIFPAPCSSNRRAPQQKQPSNSLLLVEKCRAPDTTFVSKVGGI